MILFDFTITTSKKSQLCFLIVSNFMFYKERTIFFKFHEFLAASVYPKINRNMFFCRNNEKCIVDCEKNFIFGSNNYNISNNNQINWFSGYVRDTKTKKVETKTLLRECRR